MIWTADAPSNIALIKYMGKIDAVSQIASEKNRPTNTSLSFTLPHLRSFVQLESTPGADRWEPLRSHEGRTFQPMTLSEKGSARFLAHLEFLKSRLGYKGSFIVRSANDFPSDCGLASSASSFAALTRVALLAMGASASASSPDATTVAAADSVAAVSDLSIEDAANLSRLGSGSSCRSFFEPWSVWTPTSVEGVPELARMGGLIHQVVVVNEAVKTVSSSEAHRRVTTSMLFRGRPERADERVGAFVTALSSAANHAASVGAKFQDAGATGLHTASPGWREAFEIAWAEFWDMHALFETSRPSFGYMTGGTLEVLNFVREKIWNATGDGPLVTMDAGPNVHLLYRADDAGRAQAHMLSSWAAGQFKVFSTPGSR